MRAWWFIVAAVAWGAWHVFSQREISRPPGILAAAEPRQESLQEPAPVFSKAGYKLTSLVRFDAQARVILTEHYRFDRGADLVPVDLALGWGPMSDTAVLQGLSFSQNSRFYFYSWSGAPPIPSREIAVHSANMHLIPANDRVAKRLQQVRAGNIVHFSGYLVKAEGADGWKWISSMTRTDVGAGACELVWVEELEVS